MKKYILLMLYPLTLLATPINETTDAWTCQAEDSTSKQWSGSGSFERVATNKALENCKKQSQYPVTCKTAKESCEAIINGVLTRPMWRCTALDQLSKTWKSAIYSHRDDAAIGAKDYCKEHSSMPDTCYINLLTCNNLNEGS